MDLSDRRSRKWATDVRLTLDHRAADQVTVVCRLALMAHDPTFVLPRRTVVDPLDSAAVGAADPQPTVEAIEDFGTYSPDLQRAN
jgi:hypothetical protein